jgi:hypothetical protein
LLSQYDVSDDGASWANSIDIGDLDPGEISSLLYLRYQIASTAMLSLWDLRIRAQASSWT